MKILITGGAGYKGVKLTEELLNRGHHVTILDNFMYGCSPIFGLVNNPNLDILKLDIRNIKEEHVKNFDVIYHLSGISGMPACATNPHSAEMINTIATKTLVNLLSKDQIIINAATTAIYGDNNEICTEESIIKPGSIYSKSKYEAEKIVQQKENAISLRFATVFGIAPRMRDDLIVNDFVYRALHDRNIVIFEGKSKRTAIHIDDAIRAYLFALDNFNIMKNQVYNIGDETLNFSKLDIANIIKKYNNFQIIDSTLPDLDIRNFVVSFDKIKKLGYHTTKTLEDGIEELIKLYSFYVKYSPYNII